MKGLYLILIGILFFDVLVRAEADTLKINKISKANVNYLSYALVNQTLFALSDSGRLVIWDLRKLDTIAAPYNSLKARYNAITKDTAGNVLLTSKDGSVFEINAVNFSYSLKLKIKASVYGIAASPQNRIFLISGGIYDPVSRDFWDQFKNHTTGIVATQRKRYLLFFHKSKRVYSYFSNPQYNFIDSKGRWWMTATYGEFGGDIEIFDTANKTIVDNKFGGINPGNLSPRSVFEDDKQNIYITCGLQHFMNSGEIYRIDTNRNIVKIFDGQIKPDTTKDHKSIDKDFVGPGAYNKTDKHIYFATSSGFYKAELNTDHLKPQYLFNPSLSSSREPMAIGMSMSILKLDFTIDNKLLFLTRNNGFGIYDGKNLTMLQ